MTRTEEMVLSLRQALPFEPRRSDIHAAYVVVAEAYGISVAGVRKAYQRWRGQVPRSHSATIEQSQEVAG